MAVAASGYREYVSGGGNVLLLRGFVREGHASRDKVAKEFGIVFSETVKITTIKRWAQHPLTRDLDLLPYTIGSIVTESPESTAPIAYLDNDQIVMGVVTSGKGKVVFVSTILPLLRIPQPFTKRVLDELTRKNQHPNQRPSKWGKDHLRSAIDPGICRFAWK